MPIVEDELELKKSGTIVLTAVGGVLNFEPDNANQRWVVESVSVSTDQAATATTIPVAQLALNTAIVTQLSPGNDRGSTWSGNKDIFRGKLPVGPCDFLSVLFSPYPGQSGTPLVGVNATAVVQGTKYQRRWQAGV